MKRFRYLKSPGNTNIPPRPLNGVIEAFYLTGELIDRPDEAFIDVSLRNLTLGLAQKMLDAGSRLPHIVIVH